MVVRYALTLFLSGTVLLLAGCTSESDQPDPEEPEAPPEHLSELDRLFEAYQQHPLQATAYDEGAADRWVDSVLSALSTEEKIGQLFIVDMPDPNAAGDPAMNAVRQHGVGGFLVPRLLSPERMFEETRRLQEAAHVPLFMAADYERGVGRFTNNMTELPSNMAIGATRNERYAAAAGRLSAIESRAIGVNLLFAPVVDVNNNPENPIINIRSYGEDPALVGRMANAFVQDAEANGVLTTLKHFPGHGNVDVDTHAEVGAVTGSRAELDSVELHPYRVVFEEAPRPAAVMSAHLWVQAIDEEPIPATFSRQALHNVLREELGFEGVVITDDVKMGALQNDFSLTQRVTRPLQAGADVILTPENLGSAVQAVRRSVEDGRLTEEQLNRSVRRILEAKARAGLHREAKARQEALDYLLEEPRGREVAQSIADEAITLLKTDPVLPLYDDERVALVQLSNYRNSESIGAAMDLMEDTLGTNYVTSVQFDSEPSSAQQQRVIDAAREADAVVLGLYLRLQSGRGEAGLFPAQRRLVQRLLEEEVPVILVTFGNPYAVSTFPTSEGALVAYDQTLSSVRAAVGVLKGSHAPQGRLPITVMPYNYGDGLDRIAAEPAS